MTRKDLFIELAKPNSKGVLRWVKVPEFVKRYESLKFGNGRDWCRKESSIAKEYIVEVDSSISKGNSTDRIRLNGFNLDKNLSQRIRQDIKKCITKQRCAVLGTSTPEIDHKDGRKKSRRVMALKTQVISDFQPLSKAANDAKRQFCKECKRTGNRYDAKRLGFNISFTYGSKKFNNKTGCRGCYWHDPRDFHSKLIKK